MYIYFGTPIIILLLPWGEYTVLWRPTLDPGMKLKRLSAKTVENKHCTKELGHDVSLLAAYLYSGRNKDKGERQKEVD